MSNVAIETHPDPALRIVSGRCGSRLDAHRGYPFAFARRENELVACLFDGSGDWGEGVAASRFAARAAIATTGSIEEAMAAAHQAVAGHSDDDFGAACSGVIVVVDDLSVRIGSVGGLVALIFRAGEIVHRTVPNLLVNDLLASGKITQEQIELVPQLNIVTRSLGSGDNPAVDISGPWPIVYGDLIVLCSRKIHEALPERDLLMLANRDAETVIVRGILTTVSSRVDFHELFVIALRVT